MNQPPTPGPNPGPTPGPPPTPGQQPGELGQYRALTQPVRAAVEGLADIAQSPLDDHAGRYDSIHRVLQEALSDTDLPPTN
jgi:hypothetical protein